MKTLHRLVMPAAFALAFLGSAHAADLAGKWKTEFDSQIGTQKYTFEFKAADGKLTGKAAFEREDQKGDVELTDVKVDKDTVSFVEMLKFQDQEVRIEYTGKFTGDDEIKFSRKVGDFATEELVAKRVKDK
jgi:hypothetical protein